MDGAFDSSTFKGVSNTDLVKSGWYFTDVVAVVFGITTFVGFGASALASCVGVFSKGLMAGFTSWCEGAATDGFFTGSADFSGFGAAFLGSGAAAFFTGAAFSDVFLLDECATGFACLAGGLEGAACLGAAFFAGAAFLTAGLKFLDANDALADAFGAGLAGFTPLAAAFLGATFFVAIL